MKKIVTKSYWAPSGAGVTRRSHPRRRPWAWPSWRARWSCHIGCQGNNTTHRMAFWSCSEPTSSDMHKKSYGLMVEQNGCGW